MKFDTYGRRRKRDDRFMNKGRIEPCSDDFQTTLDRFCKVYYNGCVLRKM